MSDLHPMDIEPWTDGLDVFRAAGVRVVPVEDFDYEATWVKDAKLMLIATDLTTERRRLIAEEYLPHILKQRDERADQ